MADDKDEILAMRQRIHDMSDVVQAEVTRNATMAVQLSNLVEMFKEHRTDSKAFMDDSSIKLAAISKETTETNGRVNGHDREIKDLKDTTTWAIRLIVGLNVTVVGGVIIAVIAFWATKQ